MSFCFVGRLYREYTVDAEDPWGRHDVYSHHQYKSVPELRLSGRNTALQWEKCYRKWSTKIIANCPCAVVVKQKLNLEIKTLQWVLKQMAAGESAHSRRCMCNIWFRVRSCMLFWQVWQTDRTSENKRWGDRTRTRISFMVMDGNSSAHHQHPACGLRSAAQLVSGISTDANHHAFVLNFFFLIDSWLHRYISD